MKSKLIVGQKIVKLEQSRVETNSGIHMTVDRIVLANGVSLIPTAYERENEGPVGDLILVKRKHPNEKTEARTNRLHSATDSVRACEVCGRALTQKRYDHGDDHRIYWTCDLAEGAWAHGAQHTREDAPENRKAPNERRSDAL